MGWRALEQFKNATEPGARYMRKGPTAIVLSNLDTQDKLPGSSSPPGLLVIGLDCDVGFDVVNEMIRAEG